MIKKETVKMCIKAFAIVMFASAAFISLGMIELFVFPGQMQGFGIVFVFPFFIWPLAILLHRTSKKKILKRLSLIFGIPAFIYFIFILAGLLFIGLTWGTPYFLFESRISRLNNDLRGMQEIMRGYPVNLRASRIEIRTRGVPLTVCIEARQGTFSSISELSVAEEMIVKFEEYIVSDEFICWMRGHGSTDSWIDGGFTVSVSYLHPRYSRANSIAFAVFRIDFYDGEPIAYRITSSLRIPITPEFESSSN